MKYLLHFRVVLCLALLRATFAFQSWQVYTDMQKIMLVVSEKNHQVTRQVEAQLDDITVLYNCQLDVPPDLIILSETPIVDFFL